MKSRRGKRPLALRERFPAAGNRHRNKNGVSEMFRDAVFVVFDIEAFVLTPFHSFTPYSFTPFPPKKTSSPPDKPPH